MTHPDPAAPNTIAFVGGGHMARSLIGGLLTRGTDARLIHLAEPVAELRDAWQRDFGISIFVDAIDAVCDAGTWAFAVKPEVMRGVCESLAPQAQASKPLVVSIAAGITAAQLERWLGGDVAVVRAMPNTPALLGAGVFANAQVDATGRDAAQQLLSSAGQTVWIDDEAKMDAVTAVSGSGPAYVFLLAQAMEDAARAEGLPDAAARTLVLQTVLGAARMLTEANEAPAELRRRVTSPGGTTQAAIDTFEANGFRDIVAKAIRKATECGRLLSAAND
ncbi:MAG: pyrroline-5-carboxylate reductase [Lysobacter sp.]|nr:pyrroline-5-carboxylate reductase [Lysobacter sp.]